MRRPIVISGEAVWGIGICLAAVALFAGIAFDEVNKSRASAEIATACIRAGGEVKTDSNGRFRECVK